MMIDKIPGFKNNDSFDVKRHSKMNFTVFIHQVAASIL